MNRFFAFLTSIVLALLQLAVTPLIKIGWLNYNFALVCIVVMSYLCGGKTAIFHAALISMIYDISASKLPGTYFILYVAIATIIIFCSKHMFTKNIVASLIFVVCATLISELIVYWVFYGLNGMWHSAFALSKIILPQCLINTVLSVIIFWFYNSVLKIKRT